MKRFHRINKGLAILLCACMVGGMMPLPASAEETVSGNEGASHDNAGETVSGNANASYYDNADGTVSGNAGAAHYSADGFCTGYELTADGTWAKKSGGAACTAEGCSGYQPADLTADKYDIDGDGSKDEVYEIGNAGQLYWFAGLVNGDTGVCTGEVTRNLSANAVLTADITVNENVLKSDGTLSENTDGFRSWTPIGFFSDDAGGNYYSGKFDGQSHTISGLYFDVWRTGYAGLFSGIESNAVISNVGVVDSYFGGMSAGGVCTENRGTIINCYNTGAVSGSSRFGGGVCAVNGGKIINCYNTGIIRDNARIAGGVCGSDGGTIANCYFDSTIYSGVAVGSGGSVEATAVEGKTTAQFASGEVAWLLSQGCTIGEGEAAVTYDGSVWGQKLGGEAADAAPVLKKAGDEGNTVYQNAEYPGCEKKPGDAVYVYANKAAAPAYKEHIYNGNGFCQSCDGYQPADLTTDQYDIDGDGSKDEVYEIGNAGQLYWFAGLVNGEESVCTEGVTQNYSANAVLTADITVNENVLKEDGTLSDDTSGFRSWTPIGNSSAYRGCFDGQSHAISGMYFSNPDADYVGLFHTAEADAVISNVGIRDSYFYGRNSVSAMCGRNRGTVTDCYNAGSVKGRVQHVSGVCGINFGTISSSYNTGTVTAGGGFGAGGVCGWNKGGTIRSSYNTGEVTANGRAGGVCGLNSGTVSGSIPTITGSYNTGEVTVTGSDGKAGGVCGENDGAITNSYNTGEVTATGSGCKAGGVCGYNDKGTLSNSYSTGKITAAASDGVAGGVCGVNDNTIINCCFDSTNYSGDAVGSGSGTATATEGKTTAQFASGEVAYLLNEGKTDDSQTWYQNLDSGTKDSIPVPDSTHGTVYASTPCPIKFSNSADKVVEHNFTLDPEDDTQHTCTECGHSEKHADVATFTVDSDAHSISAGCSSCGWLGTVTLSAAGAVYDGTDKAASASGTIKGITVPAIVYERKDGEAYTEIDGIPKDAGTYRAVITLGMGENAATVTVEYIIQPAAPVITWNTPASVFYTGTAVALEKLTTPVVALANGEVFDGTITYSCREHGSDAAFTEGLPTERGTYDVKAGVAADRNYTEAETTITLTIQWLETEEKAALTDKDNKSLSGDTWWAPGVTFTAPDGFTISDRLTGTYGETFTYDTETTAAGTTLTYYLKNSAGEIAEKSETVRIDRTAPDWAGDSCGINMKESWWKSLLNSISFGLFYKETVDVKVSADDSISGVAAYYYYVDSAGSTVKTAEELDELGFTAYTKVQGQKPVTVTSLASDGSYLVYAYAVDAAGNRSAYVCSDGVVVDQTAPVISDVSTPDKNASTLTDTGARISFTGSEDGTYFYVCIERNSGEPAPASITDFAEEQTHDGYSTWTAKAGVSFAPMKAGAGNEITLSGLKANTAYTLYLAAVDPVGNGTGTAVESREFTTCKTMPVITAMPAISGTYGQTVSGMMLTDGKAEVQNVELDGTWKVTDTKASDMPAVGTRDSYIVTFEPEDSRYETVSVKVIPVIAPKPVTVTAEDKTKTYGENNPEFTFTVPAGALAGSDTKENLAVVLSCPATADSPVTTEGYAITGTSASANYEVTIIPGTLTITKAEAEIILGRVSYDKTFGDADFLLDVTANHTEADVQYAVTQGADVISVADGTVSILKVGTATVTVSLPASTNYNAAAATETITVNVAKKGGYAVADINKSYFYARDKDAVIGLALYLPADCGAVAYGTPQTSGNVEYTVSPAVTDGRLTYTVKQADSAGAAGTITVPVTTDNYESFVITVKTKQVDELPVSLQSGSSVTLQNSTLTYGEALSELVFHSAVFVDEDGNVVTGVLAWKTPAATPAAGTTSAVWLFTPDDEAYAAVEDSVAITVKKAVPAVNAVPSVAGRVYDPDTALTDADLTGGSVNGVDGKALAGAWSFTGSRIVPTADNTGYQAVFTPEDTANYETVTRTITVPVAKATPYLAENPAASGVTYGQALADSTFTGGKAAYGDADGSEIAGSFVWKNGSLKPSVADSGRTEYEVTFIPSDTANYHTVEVKLTLVVNKAAQAPDMPGSEMRPAHSTAKVGDVTLPAGWSWADADKDKELPDGVNVTATAVYTGAGRGNYETESVSITITRSACEHRNTELRNRKEASCDQTGYTGDTCCVDCGALISTGNGTAAAGHDYRSSVTKQPTTTKEGIMAYTCTRCGHVYTHPIAKLSGGNTGNGSGTGTAAGNGRDNGSGTGADTDSTDNRTNAGEVKPYIKGDSGKEGWEVIRSQLDGAKSGEAVTVVMNGTTVVPENVIDSIRGEDVTLVLDMGDGISWKIHGKDITDAAGDIDFEVTMGEQAGKKIPVSVLNNVTGERYSMNLTLAYSGEFGFTATLTVNMDAGNAGLYANLFYYNEQTGNLEFVSAGQIDADGNAELAFTHASDYTIVIDTIVMNGSSDEDTTSAESESAETGTVSEPETDDTEAPYAWKPVIVIIIGICILLIASGAVFYMRKKIEK